MNDDETPLVLGIHAVLVSLLMTLEDMGQTEVVSEAFDRAGNAFVSAGLSQNKALRAKAAGALEIIDKMREAVVRHRS
ncbi:hypothetical protein J5J10_22250 [Ciceribacter sp. L1K23]|uniref:hypothetical protein n=1 Tax=Ciceribacter sp. L1K23 TaxID=2820276 RepID=UPI001B81D3B8|nr:hypothetical protein [Ciceribacter sp. L1K23]MBR0558427.1 hypothetical protein [Ciceribacter sp. L1K23]